MTSERKDDSKGLGDDQGTRVGKPEPGRSGSLGMGSEASEGIHGANGGRDASERSSLESRETGHAESQGDGSEQSGSEPLSRTTEHRSGYGGSGGAPVTSSDQREGTKKR